MSEELTYDELQAQVRDALVADPRPPTSIRLGQKQRDAILAYLRAAAGSEDIGPLTEFAGVPVIESTSEDELVIEYEDESTEEPPPSAD